MTILNNKNVNRWWKRGFFILLLISIIIIGLLVYGIIDQSVTLSYTEVGMQDLENDLLVLKSLTPELSKTLDKKDILFILRKNNPKIIIIENNNEIDVGQLRFIFKSNKLVEVKKFK